jgi:hypothetical protein
MRVVDSVTSHGTNVFLDTASVQKIPEGIAGWYRWEGKGVKDLGDSVTHILRRVVARCEPHEVALVGAHTYVGEVTITYGSFDADRKDWSFISPPPDTYAEFEMYALCRWAQFKKLIK